MDLPKTFEHEEKATSFFVDPDEHLFELSRLQ
jgi:hypothetical protein